MADLINQQPSAARTTTTTTVVATLADSSAEVCRYFARGMCRFSEMCRFAHVLDDDGRAAVANASGGDATDDDDLYTYHSSAQRNQRHLHSQQHLLTNSNSNSSTTTNSRLSGAHAAAATPKSTTGTMPSAQRIAAAASAAATTAATVTATTATTATAIRPSDPTSWVLAPVFVPRSSRPIDSATPAAAPSYAQAVGTAGSSGTVRIDAGVAAMAVPPGQTAGEQLLCPYRRELGAEGVCRYGDRCIYDHGELCDMCGRYVLSPTDAAQRKRHEEECLNQHEQNMELSFAIARSRDKTCGVCFEVIMEKSGGEQRFGILPNCNHIFCLQCIRKWRLANQFDKNIIRACPECRVTSDFVCPSAYWVDTKEEKAKLLGDYRKALNSKDCKYFKLGQGKCPFGNKCFYKHALKNGMLVDVGVPPRPVRRQNHLGDVDVLQFLLWDFMEERDFDDQMHEGRWWENVDLMYDAFTVELVGDDDDDEDDLLDDLDLDDLDGGVSGLGVGAGDLDDVGDVLGVGAFGMHNLVGVGIGDIAAGHQNRRTRRQRQRQRQRNGGGGSGGGGGGANGTGGD